MEPADAPIRPEDHAARSAYWENVHDGKDEDGVSWWQSVPELSLGLVDETGLGIDRSVIDVGAGWSTLVDHLVERGYTDLTAIDLSQTALNTVRDRVGEIPGRLDLDVADVLDFRPPRQFALWHDRAVLHFLTSEPDRVRYVDVVRAHLDLGGHAIIGTFSPNGPTSCSGLDIQQYDIHDIIEENARQPG